MRPADEGGSNVRAHDLPTGPGHGVLSPMEYLDPDELHAARIAATAHAQDADDARLILTALGLIPDPVTPPEHLRNAYGRSNYRAES